jgi:hypothetical protein
MPFQGYGDGVPHKHFMCRYIYSNNFKKAKKIGSEEPILISNYSVT